MITTAKYNYGDNGFIEKLSMLVKSYNLSIKGFKYKGKIFTSLETYS